MKTTFKQFCKCQHKFQDETYGKQIRVFNKTSKDHPDGTTEVRCTVCGTIQRVKKD